MIRAIKLSNRDRKQLISDYNVLCRVHGKDINRTELMARLGILKEVEVFLEQDKEVGLL